MKRYLFALLAITLASTPLDLFAASRILKPDHATRVGVRNYVNEEGLPAIGWRGTPPVVSRAVLFFDLSKLVDDDFLYSAKGLKNAEYRLSFDIEKKDTRKFVAVPLKVGTIEVAILPLISEPLKIEAYQSTHTSVSDFVKAYSTEPLKVYDTGIKDDYYDAVMPIPELGKHVNEDALILPIRFQISEADSDVEATLLSIKNASLRIIVK
jgi:hypothetical protein